VAGELRRRGRKVALQDQPFQVLAVLLRRRGEIVARAELHQALWPADTFVEFEHGLNTAINKLRQAMGDSADNPRFIETLPRKGYRFIAPVSSAGTGSAEVPRPNGTSIDSEPTPPAAEMATAPPPPEIPAAPPELVRPAPRRHWLRWAAGALAGVALVAGAWWLWGKRGDSRQWSALPFINYPGAQGYPSFSPDGNKVVFSWTRDDWKTSHIHSIQFGSFAPVQLTTQPALDLSPAFSPDGNSIGFVRCLEKTSGCTLVIIPSAGGAERMVAQLQAPAQTGLSAYDYFTQNFGPIFAWLPDGEHVVINGLTLLNNQTGERRALTTPSPSVWPDYSPAVSPDGRSIAFARAANGVPKPYLLHSSLYRIDLGADLQSKGEPRRIATAWNFCHSPNWTPDGRRIVFVAAGFGVMIVNASGSAEPEGLQIPVGAGNLAILFATLGLNPGLHIPVGAGNLALSCAGNRLVLGGVRPRIVDLGYSRLWRYRLSDSKDAVGSPTHFAANFPYSMRYPQYSPDGKRVAIQYLGIWVGDADGSNLTQVFTRPDSASGTPRWAPDGERLAFDHIKDGTWRVYTISSNGGEPTLLTPGRNFAAIPSWSADGKWIYFASTVNRQFQVWKIPASGGEAVQVTRKGGMVAFESRDGKTLYYTKHDDGESGALYGMPVGGGEEEVVAPSVAGRDFAIGASGVYVVEGGGEQDLVRYMPFATRKAKTIAAMPQRGNGIAISPDERSLLVVQMDQRSTDLMLVENFRP
jgi:Tol biopolymer transport system component/DNA-binding winged helix-turn-helix (wHTH) protein